MNPDEISRLQTYLRKMFGNNTLTLVPPPRKGGTVEVKLEDEFIGTVHRDDEDGDVSYAVQIAVLAEDLPPPKK